MKVLHCDICDTDRGVVHLGLFVGTSPDGAGSYVSDFEYADLCNSCLVKVYQRVFKEQLKEPEVNKKLWVVIRSAYSKRMKEGRE